MRMKQARRGYAGLMGDKRKKYRILERKPLGKRTSSWKENVVTDFKKQDGRSLDGWMWVRMGSNGRLLWSAKWTFVFRKMLGMYTLSTQYYLLQNPLHHGVSQSLRFHVQALLRLSACLHASASSHFLGPFTRFDSCSRKINHLKPTVHVIHHQFNIQQLYALPTLYLCVFYLSENKQRLVPLTA